MKRRDEQKLQRLINRKAKTNTADFMAGRALDDFCEVYYGHSPSDVDADEIIDALLGGNGGGSSMTVWDFDAAMRRAEDRHDRD